MRKLSSPLIPAVFILTAICFAALGVGAIGLDDRTGALLSNTVWLALATCTFSLPLGTLLALLLVRTDMPYRQVFLTVFGAMLFVPLYIQMAAWHAVFQQLNWYGAGDGNLVRPLIDGWQAVVWTHSVAAIPWVVLIVGLAMRLVERQLEEQALLDGSAGQVLFWVTLPRVMPAIAVAALWVLVTTAGEITVTDIYRVETYAREVYMFETIGEAKYSFFCASAVLALLVAMAMLVAYSISPPHRSLWQDNPFVFRLGAWKIAAAVFVLTLIVLFTGVPLVHLVMDAGLVVQQSGQRLERAWSVVKFVETVAYTLIHYRTEYSWTLVIGVAAATISLGMAAPMAWLARRHFAWSLVALLVAAIGLGAPGPLIGLSLTYVFSLSSLPLVHWLHDRTILLPTLAMTIRAAPIAILVMWYAFRSIAQNQLDSASVDGAGPWVLFWSIAVRQRIAAITAVWIIALAVACGDVAASILTLPPGVETIQRRVFGLVHDAMYDRVAGICLVMAGTFIAIASVLLWTVRSLIRYVDPNS